MKKIRERNMQSISVSRPAWLEHAYGRKIVYTCVINLPYKKSEKTHVSSIEK